jgi:hypothetical protein
MEELCPSFIAIYPEFHIQNCIGLATLEASALIEMFFIAKAN